MSLTQILANVEQLQKEQADIYDSGQRYSDQLAPGAYGRLGDQMFIDQTDGGTFKDPYFESLMYGNPNLIEDYFSTGRFQDFNPRSGIYNAIPTSEPEVIYPTSNDLDEEMGRLYDIQPYSRMDGILSTLKDYGKDIAGRSIASQALANAGAMIGGLPLALAGLVYGGIKGGDLFNAPYIGAGAATVDEYGNMYTAEQLDKLNAAGGYYSDPARSSRRRDARIRNMIERRDAGLKIGLNNLAKLQEQQRREEAARQSAADAMQASNIANRTGGYQASETSSGAGDGYSDDFMGGSGTAAEMGSF